MEGQAKCARPDYEDEYRRQLELNQRMSNEIQDMKAFFERQEREHAIMKAQLDIVYLIFGGGNHA